MEGRKEGGGGYVPRPPASTHRCVVRAAAERKPNRPAVLAEVRRSTGGRPNQPVGLRSVLGLDHHLPKERNQRDDPRVD